MDYILQYRRIFYYEYCIICKSMSDTGFLHIEILENNAILNFCTSRTFVFFFLLCQIIVIVSDEQLTQK